MHVYFVRHGQTLLNKQNIHQSPNTPLSEKGKEAILTVAESLRLVNADLLITSNYTRALETARIIASRTGLTPRETSLLREIVRPSDLYHQHIYTPKTAWYLFQTFRHRTDEHWHFKDAESVHDIETRISQLTGELEGYVTSHQSIIVVSHTVFLHLLVATIEGTTLHLVKSLFQILFSSLRMKNGSVIHMECVQEGTRYRWLRHDD